LEACKELRHPNVPIGNVAYSVGFNDPSYFTRVFRRYVGCSPSEFCDRIKRGGSDKREMDTVEKHLLPELQSLKVERRQKERWPISVDRMDA
jgi:AraC-like DNA-binding protein